MKSPTSLRGRQQSSGYAGGVPANSILVSSRLPFKGANLFHALINVAFVGVTSTAVVVGFFLLLFCQF